MQLCDALVRPGVGCGCSRWRSLYKYGSVLPNWKGEGEALKKEARRHHKGLGLRAFIAELYANEGGGHDAVTYAMNMQKRVLYIYIYIYI